jgi:hypothetical protein
MIHPIGEYARDYATVNMLSLLSLVTAVKRRANSDSARFVYATGSTR